MWDLDTLRWLNERACLSAQKLVSEKIGEQTGQPAEVLPEPVFPLSILAAKLVVGPPLLSRLIDLLENSNVVVEFIELVREFLPEYEGEIMSQVEDESRIRHFCSHFNNRYFPLGDVSDYLDDFTLGDFIQHIPVELMGFAYDDYEEFNSFRDGFILLLALVESPFDDTSRVPILERVKELVGRELLALIPPEGWSLEDIHRMLDETKFEGCAAFADWTWSSTGFLQLDANYADYGPEAWDRELVDTLTRQWPGVVDYQDKMHRMFDWLEEDIFHNFERLLSAMLGTEYEEVPKEQIPFPLDDEGQVIRKEVTVIER
ncbi:hypothetical protein ES708_05952 [subsurface metagenome]